MLFISACVQPLAQGQLRLQSPLPTLPVIVKHSKPDLPLIGTRAFSDTLGVADPADDAAKKKYGLDAQSIGTCHPEWNQPIWQIERENCPWIVAMAQTECD